MTVTDYYIINVTKKLTLFCTRDKQNILQYLDAKKNNTDEKKYCYISTAYTSTHIFFYMYIDAKYFVTGRGLITRVPRNL